MLADQLAHSQPREGAGPGAQLSVESLAQLDALEQVPKAAAYARPDCVTEPSIAGPSRVIGSSRVTGLGRVAGLGRADAGQLEAGELAGQAELAAAGVSVEAKLASRGQLDLPPGLVIDALELEDQTGQPKAPARLGAPRR